MSPFDGDPSYLSTRQQPRGGSLLADLEAYWQDLRGARQIPARTDVDPSALDAVLPWSFVAERIAPQVLRIRVAGQRITAMFGMEPRGMPLCSLFTAQGREVIGPLLAAALDEPAIIELPVEAVTGLMRAKSRGRMILLPMTDAHGEVSRLMGAILVDGPDGRRLRLSVPEGAGAPRIDPVASMRRAAPKLVARSGLAGPFSAAPPQPPGRLRLVVNNG